MSTLASNQSPGRSVVVKSASPSLNEVHVNAVLTDFMIAYKQDLNNFVARRAFPTVPVQHRSDFYISLPKGQMYRTVAGKRADATETPGRIYNIKNDNTYLCNVYGVHQDMGQQVMRNADAGIDLEQQIVMGLTQDLYIRQEMDWTNTYFRKGVWTGLVKQNGTVTDFDLSDTSYSGGPWDAVNSTPIDDIDFAKFFMLSRTGQEPNKLIMTTDVFVALKNHPQIIERYKYDGSLIGTKGAVTEQILAGLFGVDEVMVCKAVFNNAQEGQQDQMGFIQQNAWLLCYAPPAPGQMIPSAGYTFEWQNYFAGGALPGAVSTFPMPHLKATRYEAELAYDMAMIGSDLGIYGINTLAKSTGNVIL